MDYLSTPLSWWVKALWNCDKLQDSFLKIQHQQITFEVNFSAYFFWYYLAGENSLFIKGLLPRAKMLMADESATAPCYIQQLKSQ